MKRSLTGAFFLALLLGTVASAAATPLPHPRQDHAAKPQVFYFVLTDRFANGNTANDTGGQSGTPEEHGFDPTRISHFHGGDFVGLSARLDYLQQLGVTAIWVTPPFKNKPVQAGTAGYHGYWILDFLNIDPHLGTNAEFRDFVEKAHARGIRVFLDVIVNHTADVIYYQERETSYRPEAAYPWRDGTGRLFDEGSAAYNGLSSAPAFPTLSSEKSFAYRPVVPAEEAQAKNPVWLNDPIFYHNRGNSRFSGESSIHGDFVGLDDLFTEHPRVVQGLIEIFSSWIREYKIDGFRIDTARHVNSEFWAAFCPAMHAAAAEIGRKDFLMFGEVANDSGDPRVLSEFSTALPIDTTLDFGFFAAARDYVSRGHPSDRIAQQFRDDDYYIDHDSNAYVTPTFLGNHDAGRFGHFLRKDNYEVTDNQLIDLMKFGHALMFFARGQPIVYYGDEQGMAGFGNDMAARETMFASRAKPYRELALIGSRRTGADDKFDPEHPLYRTIAELAALRVQHPTLATGSMLVHDSANSRVFAFSRLDRSQRVEYLAAFNNSREEPQVALIRTHQPAGARLQRVHASRPQSVAASQPVDAVEDDLRVDAGGYVQIRLEPLQYVLWRATNVLPTKSTDLKVRITAPAPDAPLRFTQTLVDGLVFPTRQPLEAQVEGGDGVAEVTFLLSRASRPGQYELLGVDDTPPYRVFWRPAADMTAGDTIAFTAVVDDLRGNRAQESISGLTVAKSDVDFGIRGSVAPHFTHRPPDVIEAKRGGELALAAVVTATPAATYQWLKDGQVVPGAESVELRIRAVERHHAGVYTLRARNLAGTTLSSGTTVRVVE